MTNYNYFILLHLELPT